MNRTLIAAIAFVAAAPAVAADVGVSVSVGQPSFYGRIDIGNYPQPALVYAQPVVIAPAPVARLREPIYLHVPPGHAKKWDKHCARYGACGQPVYFVQENWYQSVYVPEHAHRGADHRDKGPGKHEGKGKGKHKDKHKGKGNH